MAHYCICSVCGVRFDRDKIQAVKSGARRYAHYDCLPSGEIVPLPQVDENLEKLINYTKNLLGESYNAARVKKQIKDFKEEYNYSYNSMLKCLIYFYEVKGNSKEKANGGIGIIPFIYNDAYNYYLSLFYAKQANENKEITSKVKEITIKPPEVAIKKHFFEFLEDEHEE